MAAAARAEGIAIAEEFTGTGGIETAEGVEGTDEFEKVEVSTEVARSVVTLTVASAYRSYNNQDEIYNRYVRQMGQAAADRVSAQPGHSQHQLGLVVDFHPISDEFANTDAGRWMVANASRFGWSLSYPRGREYESITGYTWESWHYRFVGRRLTDFIDTYFGGIQQFALRFLHEWNIYDTGF